MNNRGYRILFEGERWFGSDAGSCLRALRRQGHEVVDLDVNTIIPGWNSIGLKLVRRAILPVLIREHNRNILEAAREFKPHFFLAFKGHYVLPGTLLKLKAQGIPLYNFYPDVSAFSHQSNTLPRALQIFDCVFSTKTFLAADLERQGFPLQRWEQITHGYDPDAHHPVDLDQDEMSSYAAAAAFIGGHTAAKEQTLRTLKRLLPKLDLAIWGDRWQRVDAPELKASIRSRSVVGVEYMKVICATKIILALLSERQKGSSQGDEVTSRTFNIPACGAFMLHERTAEVLKYYREGQEIECYHSPEEMAEKIEFYLTNPEKRKAIAEAGYRRCVPAYSLDNQVLKILEWHEKRG